MAITYYMLQIPAWLFFTCIVFFGAASAGLVTNIFRKTIRVKILRSHNEVTGFLFLAIASFYALLLAFVVLIVWEKLNETHGDVSKEGSSALALYRDVKFYPDSLASKELKAVYLDYVFNVLDDEFPKMKLMESSQITAESFDKLFYTMERLNPTNPMQIQLVSGMFHHLNELATYRSLRISSMETEIPAPMWLPIIFGAIITLFCAMFLDIEHIRMHVLLNSLLGGFIGAFIFTIILLDHPYTGSLGIEPHAYEQIFTLEEWDQENKIKDQTNTQMINFQNQNP